MKLTVLVPCLLSLVSRHLPAQNAYLGNAATASDTLPDTLNVWVYFKDKNFLINPYLDLKDVVSPRSIERRLKVRPESLVIDYTDLPVTESYVQGAQPHVLQLHHCSRWLNGISVTVLKKSIREIEALPFVKGVDLSSRYGRTNGISGKLVSWKPNRSADSLDYGYSFAQLNLINIPAVHQTGNYGQGVLIGVFDSGFDLAHESLRHLDVVATRDFVENKDSVLPAGGTGEHGTKVLSTLAGYKPGILIGPAFRASFVLARTEISSMEIPSEMDAWIAALEWADSIGVDIVTSSLSYGVFSYPYRSYQSHDMNGDTAFITRVADLAVSKGIIILNSAGNAGFVVDSSINTLTVPADGDSVLAIGAVDLNGDRAYFSSFGPTTDNPPRIKPDLMAPGLGVIAASPVGPSGPRCRDCYFRVNGTSFSAPFVAGVVALILHDHPRATPMGIIEALKMTASRGQSPDKFYGWGIVNAEAAIRYLR